MCSHAQTVLLSGGGFLFYFDSLVFMCVFSNFTSCPCFPSFFCPCRISTCVSSLALPLIGLTCDPLPPRINSFRLPLFYGRLLPQVDVKILQRFSCCSCLGLNFLCFSSHVGFVFFGLLPVTTVVFFPGDIFVFCEKQTKSPPPHNP